MRAVFLAALLSIAASPSLAQADLKPMDPAEVDPAMLEDFYGPWQIMDESGKKACRVVLKKDVTIGGQEIEIDPACARVFPVMDEIAAWRLMEGWAIDLADATRNRRIRFFTPDERYVAEPETDGIFTIEQLPK